MNVPRVLALVREAALTVPVIIMTYLNPVMAFGIDRFVAQAHAAGVAGVLLTDLPAGADSTIEAAVTRSALALIRLVAPTTDDERLAAAVNNASGFIYLISRLGVTGARKAVPPDLEAHVARVRALTKLPIAVGFGIGTPAQAAAAARYADGVVVGSALMDALTQGGVGAAERLARELAAAVHA
jgi:tryptophan synthase alpha chain